MRGVCGVALTLALSMLVGCVSRTQAGMPPSADDGSLFATVLPATATVLKDGRIAGSGAFVSHQSHFLTAAHVVHNPADRIELLLPDGRIVPARTVAVDLGHDLAVLETDLGDRPHGALLGFSDGLSPPGALIFLIGAPSMLEEAFIPGRVARDRTGFNFLSNHGSYARSLLIAADAAPGTSGGCWVDARGGIVGVQSAFIGDDLGSLGLGFIAPADEARRLVQSLADRPTATLGAELVGLRTQPYGFTKRFPPGSAGVVTHRVFQGGALGRAGITNEQLITHLDGRPVVDLSSLFTLVRSHQPGDAVELTVVSPDGHAVNRVRVELDVLKWD